ncbi:MAG: hypothetical protein DDT40_01290 [candidate division WS2 bacterium]|nr:hypothetical protein [Candidatus Psychracetigena formicireducens]
MKIEKTKPPVVDEILNKLEERYSLNMQREGIHCTEVLYCLRRAFWDKTDPVKASLQETMYYLSGLGLQDTLLGGDLSPQPIKVDEIWMSPDYYQDGILAELKTTMIGQKRLDAYDFPEGWVKQLMCYCYGLKKDRAVLIVLTLIKRELFTYVLTFTEEELKENWNWVTSRAKQLQSALEKSVIPEEKGSEWQCNNCRYRLRCILDVSEMNLINLRKEKEEEK